jgi:phospholipase/carboxylesterase
VPTRRELLRAGAAAGLAALLAGCGRRVPASPTGSANPTGPEALSARPADQPPEPLLAAAPEPGTSALGRGGSGGPLLHVPPGLPAGELLPLVVSLHGAGGDAEAGLALLRPLAEEFGLVLLAPSSAGPTWDAVRGDHGADAQQVDSALAEVFGRLPIDPGRVWVAGFSDGGSYALGLGLANGHLFSSVVAFSPGFVPSGARSGKPAIFVSHGTADEVLPVERTSRRIVPALEEDGYEVTYREFAGPHTVPPEVARAAVEWLGVA